MYKGLESLVGIPPTTTFIFCAGFEERVLRAPVFLDNNLVVASRVLILTYPGDENNENLTKLRQLAKGICLSGKIDEFEIGNLGKFLKFICNLDYKVDNIVLDITGMSRVGMMSILSVLYDSALRVRLIYTEAAEYFPSKAQFDELTKGNRNNPEESFLKLSQFERNNVAYSMHCDVEEIEGLNGRLLPNYPLILITFLTFKRGRVAAILQAFEANVRILIKSVPVRSDLKWRGEAIELPNLDLIEDGRGVKELGTLDWQETYNFLMTYYSTGNIKYKFNIVLAPLGSKMQTVGAWLFAKEVGEIKVVSSTPKKLFYEQYSIGYGESFVVDNLPFGLGSL